MLITSLAVLCLQAGTSGTELLPIPFPSPSDPGVRSTLVKAEKALAKSDFAEAGKKLDEVSLDKIRYSVDVSRVPEARRKAAEEALIAGVELWVAPLAGKATLVRDDADPLIRLIMTPGFGSQAVSTMVAGMQNMMLGCQEMSWEPIKNGHRLLTVRIYNDEGPEGTPHSKRSLMKLAGKGIGYYYGLAPTTGAVDLMSFDIHGGFNLPKPQPSEIVYVQAVLKAVADIRAHAADKKKVDLELPELTIQDHFDLGVTNSGQSAKAELEFKNTGNATLRVKEVLADCKCVAKEWDQEVEPGKTGTIRVTVDTANTNGIVSKRLVVKSNDTDNADKVIQLNLVSMRTLSTYPSNMTSLDLPSQGGGETQFFVYSPVGKQFKVAGIECTPTRYKATFEAGKLKFQPSEYPNLPNVERDGWVVKVQIPDGEGFGGQFAGRFRVMTDDTSEEGQVIFTVRLTKGIQTTPGVLHVGVRGEDTDRRVVQLEQRLGEFKVLGVELSQPEMDFTTETVEAGHKYRIWFSPKKGLEPGTRSLRALILTDSPVQPKVPVTIWLDVAAAGGK